MVFRDARPKGPLRPDPLNSCSCIPHAKNRLSMAQSMQVQSHSQGQPSSRLYLGCFAAEKQVQMANRKWEIGVGLDLEINNTEFSCWRLSDSTLPCTT